MRNDIANHIDIAQTIAPGNQTSGNATGSDVDLANYDAAAVVISIGTASDTAYSIEVQHAEDDGTGSADTYEAVSDDLLDGTEPGTVTANSVTTIGYHGTRRWLRAVATDGGTGNADMAVSVVRAKGRVKT